MASGTILLTQTSFINLAEGKGTRMMVSWESTPNYTNDTSDIVFTFTYSVQASHYFEAELAGRVQYGVYNEDDGSFLYQGVASTPSPQQYVFNAYTNGVKEHSFSIEVSGVPHNSKSGKCKMFVSFSGTGRDTTFEQDPLLSQLYYWYFEPLTLDSGTKVNQADITLDTLTRKASFVSAPNFRDTDSPTINYSNPLGERASKLMVCIAHGEDVVVPYRDIDKTGSSYTFNFTNAEITALRNTVKSGTSSKVTFVLWTTAYGKNYRDYKSRTLTINPDAPEISATVEDVNEVTLGLTGNKDTIVRYHSDAQITMSAIPKNGGTITSLKAVCGDKELSENGTMTSVENGRFVFYVTDSWDNIGALVIDKTFIPYVKLTCNCSANTTVDGLVNLIVRGNYFNGSFGAKSNSLTLRYRYCKQGENIEDEVWTTLPLTADSDSYNATTSFTLADYNYKSQYTLQVYASDALTTIYKSLTLQSTPVFDWDKKDFNFNVPIYLNNAAKIEHDNVTNKLYIENDSDICFCPNGRGDTTGQMILSPDGEVAINGLNLSGLVNSMTQRYELPATFTPRNGYSSASGSLYLYGNTIRGYVSVTRDSSIAAGNAPNENVCGVQFDSGGKVTGFGAVSFVSGTNGGVTSFQMTETGIYDSSSTEEGQGYFTITLCSTNVAGDSWNAYFTFPVLLDLNKF